MNTLREKISKISTLLTNFGTLKITLWGNQCKTQLIENKIDAYPEEIENLSATSKT